jgi:hypothetical protein
MYPGLTRNDTEWSESGTYRNAAQGVRDFGSGGIKYLQQEQRKRDKLEGNVSGKQ